MQGINAEPFTYGRRRVGKTFLVDKVFHDDMVFHHTGLAPYDRHRKVTLDDLFI